MCDLLASMKNTFSKNHSFGTILVFSFQLKNIKKVFGNGIQCFSTLLSSGINKINKTGLQPVSKSVEQDVGFQQMLAWLQKCTNKTNKKLGFQRHTLHLQNIF